MAHHPPWPITHHGPPRPPSVSPSCRYRSPWWPPGNPRPRLSSPGHCFWKCPQIPPGIGDPETPRWTPTRIFMWKRTVLCPKNPGKTRVIFWKPWESLVKHHKFAGYSMLQYPLCRAADLENSGSSNLRSAGNHGSSQSSNRGVQSSGCFIIKKNGAKTLVFGSFFDHLNHLHQSLVQMDVRPPKRMPLVLANPYGVWDDIKHPILRSRCV